LSCVKYPFVQRSKLEKLPERTKFGAATSRESDSDSERFHYLQTPHGCIPDRLIVGIDPIYLGPPSGRVFVRATAYLALT